ncbi:ABC transporter substrate-binding protein [Allostreptomyces psammosilenae]|uniref:Peptide/nickel transport system substrate-binding protein n=1 Tax=Allostreptomyces psammosilenae TaxID=1892865 RepID=A0A852ZT43_9ACTN|nr:ABC transporter substrate-binding protein [Allostreptomyces psammosilenae]NYI05005.1 peptide/nickel transport system substrate-binding protein [Allostreptomyces psammosilenae]
MNHRRLGRAVAAVAAVAVVAGCTSGGGNTEPGTSAAPSSTAPEPVEQQNFRIGTAEESRGPAPEVEGARSGGTIKVYDQDDHAHLDPQKIYVNSESTVAKLFSRQLTTYTQIDGSTVLVGDLATDTGTPSDGGRTWTFTLKDDVNWEDGQPVTSADVKYGIERSFGEGMEVGPPYFQQWLTGTSSFTEAQQAYGGPRDGELDAIETPDDKTVVFHFAEPQADVPFAAAMPTATPVREDKDTGADYDVHPFSNGPYKITEREFNSTLVMERNEYWVPETDPARYQFADRYEWQFGLESLNINQRILEEPGSMTVTSVLSPELIDQVDAMPNRDQVLNQGLSPYVDYFYINTRRITDRTVREALLYGLPREQIRQVEGGPMVGEFASTITSPTLYGFQEYDLFEADPAGDPARVAELLAEAGRENLRITYAYPNTDRWQQIAQALVAGYEASGIEVVATAVDSTNYYDVIADPDNEYDLYWGGWGADWPTPSTVLPVILDGRQPGDLNHAFYDDEEVNAEIDRISALSDPDEKSAALYALEREVMADVPLIPYVYNAYNQLHGSGLGNVRLDPVHGLNALNGVYVAE